MALVVGASALAGDAERLTRARAGPDGQIVGHACEAKRVRPASNSGEQVNLIEPVEVVRLNVGNRPLVDFAIGDLAFRNQVSQPLRREGVVLVVIGGHRAASCSTAASEARRRGAALSSIGSRLIGCSSSDR